MTPLLLARIRYRTETGATAVEYALMASLIAVAIVVSVGLFGGSVLGLFQNASVKI
ncbi:Flp family type IVb pilin [Phycicoccus duodecadis]|uniref:Pilus assembly protein Flp/PilA n=1 Tax=Phycicoccus duodecadis TaxID=173053 RepID=A0A2N3YJZ8_9MICO|nr:Flp family type IVb pilin [Phycicoccus duodecadis]PKW27170.1 pilus assembly protein Flp/PilA [Phycicoccus duodecadis]